MGRILPGILTACLAALSAACGGRSSPAPCTGAECEASGPCQVPAAWSSTGWHFRRAIQVSGTPAGPQVGYAAPAALDTTSLVAAGKLQASASDLRFVGASGVDLPWWRESTDPSRSRAR